MKNIIPTFTSETSYEDHLDHVRARLILAVEVTRGSEARVQLPISLRDSLSMVARLSRDVFQWCMYV